MKKFFIFLFGMIFTVVLAFGGSFFFIARSGGMGGLVEGIPQIEFSDEIKNMSILAYVKKAMGVLQNTGSATLGEMEDALGIPLTSKISEMLGVSSDSLRGATISTLPDALMNSFTVQSLEEKFGVVLPDMPIFKTEEFRTQPLMEAFNSLSDKLNPDKMTVSDLEQNFGIQLSENPIFTDPAIANATVGNLGAALNEVQLSAMLGVVYLADVEKFNATHVATEEELVAWKADKLSYADWLKTDQTAEFDYFDTAEEQAAYIESYNAQDPKPERQMIEYWAYALEAEKAAIYNGLYPETGEEPKEEEPKEEESQPAPLPEPTDKIFAKPVAPTVAAEGVSAPTESSALIKKLSVNKLGDMTSTGGSDKVIDKILNNSTLGEIIEINPDDSILYGLKDSKISTLDSDIKNLALNNIMTIEDSSSAAMKFLVGSPLRDDKEPWKKVEGGEDYQLDENGNRIPNYLQATDESGNLVFDENGNAVYVYATINTIDAKIKQMVIGDILEAPAEGAERNVILDKVNYSTLDSLDADLTKAIDETTIGEIVKAKEGEEQSAILNALADTKISELNKRMGTLTINDVIPAPTSSEDEHVVIKKLRAMNKGSGVLISKIGTEIGTVVDNTTLGELMTIDEKTSSSIMIALKDTKISEFDAKVKTLTLEELVGADALYEKQTGSNEIDYSKPKGVLGLIDAKNREDGNSTVTIANIGEKATGAIQTANLEDLRNAGLLPPSTENKDDPNYKTAQAVDMIIKKNPEATIYTLPSAIVDLMMTATIGELYDAGLITVEGVNSLSDAVRAMSLQSLLDNAIKTPFPPVPAAA